ncbi:DNA-binding transcriptional ArsR family regulator [Actinoalloteichus hoggarensis]|uniref:Helix-turn-helix domain protein n=1 Tax=Actinoalloteichus hoggarensis TaxID=1470176 RepID=A0A221W132_9PSEU|nr:transcriptional regulator [Actinoalloteichus hoggarensis]ASO19496.1 Helix-turn-helix domain protein [Actinoalloteichus hoggarensis]MBB5919798.1 DNA-binding transcriptional ArsR family regulator [Actinoalloteichus hoggarensis]
MTEPFEEIAGLDRLLHEPARLAIVTALSACAAADFLYLQRLTGLSKGNLSAHLAKLEAAGTVEIDKRFVGKKAQTSVRLTGPGLEAVADYWRRLDRLRDEVRDWKPAEEP